MATPAFKYQDPFPLAKDTTKYRLLTHRGRLRRQLRRQGGPEGRALGAHARRPRGAPRGTVPSCCARAQRAGRQDPARPGGVAERQGRRPRLPAQRRGRRAAASSRSARTPAPPPSSARRASRSGPARRTRSTSPRASTRPTPRRTCATRRPSRSTCTRRSTPAPTCRRRSTSTRPQGAEYKFLFVAKGGGSANKTYLFQETKALLNPEQPGEVPGRQDEDTSAPPPARRTTSPSSIGGTSAESCLKTVKLASTKYLDAPPHRRQRGRPGLPRPRAGGEAARGGARSSASARSSAASTSPTTSASSACRATARPARSGMGVSCSADRNIKAKINQDGIWLEQMDHNPGRLIPEQYRGKHEHGVKIDLNQPMKEILAELSKHPVSTPLLLTGTIVVGARHRARQVQGAPRRRQAASRVPEEPPDLLRRPGQDPGRQALRLLRPDHRRPDGLLRRPAPGQRRLAW